MTTDSSSSSLCRHVTTFWGQNIYSEAMEELINTKRSDLLIVDFTDVVDTDKVDLPRGKVVRDSFQENST